MAFRADLAAMQFAVYDHYGEPVSWPGLVDPVLVLRGDPEQVVGFGQSAALISNNTFKVRSSEVAAPTLGMVFTGEDESGFPGQAFKIVAEPRSEDRLGSEWTFEAVPVA